MALAPEQVGIGIRRHFTEAGVAPLRHASSGNAATRASPTGRTAPTPSPGRRRVPGQLVAERHQHRRPEVLPRHPRHRRARDVAEPGDRPRRRHDHAWGVQDGYFTDEAEGAAFRDELKYILVTQRAAFNTPVWFNIGVQGVPQQASACFILAVEDTMDGILNWYREEGIIFKGGSGSGINLSNIRSSVRAPEGRRHRQRPGELHARRRRVGGHDQERRQDPPRRQDGHPQRRPPRRRGVHLVQGHRGAQGARAARRRLRHGPRRQRLHSIQYQNANNSVRVTDEFMQAVIDDADWDLDAVTTGEPIKTVKARDLFRQISQAAWECADPGMQFDTTINRWHTAPNTGRINASNPCSRVHAPRQLGVQPRQHQPAEVPRATTAPSTSRPSSTRSR